MITLSQEDVSIIRERLSQSERKIEFYYLLELYWNLLL
jgi:hypothetical protein